MYWAFVDYENVGSLESLKLSDYQRLIVFVGPRHRKLNLGDIPTDNFSQLEVIRMESTGKNNLDFHLAFYLGLHHQRAGKDIEFHVVSNDTGFSGIVQHLKSIGRKCRLLPTGNKGKKKAAKKVAKKKTAKKAVAKAVAKKAQGKIITARKAAEIMAKIKPEKRPKTIKSLKSWLKDMVNANVAQVDDLYARMLKFCFISEEGNKVIYRPLNESDQ